MALLASDLSNSGHLPIVLLVDGSGCQISNWPEHWRRRLTEDVEGLPRLGFDPFSIDVGYILLEERWVVQLAEHVSKYGTASRVVFKAERTCGIL